MSGLNGLDPDFRQYAQDLVTAAGAAGLMPQVTSGRRTRGEQKRLYERYVQGRSAYPAAPPGTSAHEAGMAFDMIVTPMSALSDVGRFWEREMGGKWGGHFHDPIHFESPEWHERPENLDDTDMISLHDRHPYAELLKDVVVVGGRAVQSAALSTAARILLGF